MQSNAHGVIATLSQEMLGLNKHISQAQAGIGKVQLALMGLAGLTVGAGVLTFLHGLEKAGEDLAHQQALLQTALGGTADAQRQVAEATKAAWDVTRSVPGTTAAGNMEALRDLRQVFGSLAEAETLLPRFQKMAQALADVGGKVADAGGGQAFLAARMMELRGGLFNPDGSLNEAKVSQLEALTRVAVGTGGRVDPAAYLRFIQQARASGMNLSDQSLFGTLPAVMMAMGGFRAGTGLQQAWKAIVTGRMTKQGHAEAVELGLASEQAKHTTGETATSGGLLNFREFATDPIQWVVSTLMPALKAHGITDDVGIAKTINSIFTDRTAAGFILELSRGIISAEKEGVNIAQVAPDPYKTLEGADVAQRWRDLSSAWINMKTAFGGPLVEPAMALMKRVTDAMNALTKAAAEHPDAVRTIGIGLASVAAALALFGAATIVGVLVTFAPAGAATLAFISIIGGITALSVALEKAPWTLLWERFLKPFRMFHDLLSTTPLGDGSLKDPNFRQQSYHPGASGGDRTLHVNVYLDGKQISSRIARAADGPLTGTGSFDGSRNMLATT